MSQSAPNIANPEVAEREKRERQQTIEQCTTILKNVERTVRCVSGRTPEEWGEWARVLRDGIVSFTEFILSLVPKGQAKNQVWKRVILETACKNVNESGTKMIQTSAAVMKEPDHLSAWDGLTDAVVRLSTTMQTVVTAPEDKDLIMTLTEPVKRAVREVRNIEAQRNAILRKELDDSKRIEEERKMFPEEPVADPLADTGPGRETAMWKSLAEERQVVIDRLTAELETARKDRDSGAEAKLAAAEKREKELSESLQQERAKTATLTSELAEARGRTDAGELARKIDAAEADLRTRDAELAALRVELLQATVKLNERPPPPHMEASTRAAQREQSTQQNLIADLERALSQERELTRSLRESVAARSAELTEATARVKQLSARTPSGGILLSSLSVELQPFASTGAMIALASESSLLRADSTELKRTVDKLRAALADAQKQLRTYELMIRRKDEELDSLRELPDVRLLLLRRELGPEMDDVELSVNRGGGGVGGGLSARSQSTTERNAPLPRSPFSGGIRVTAAPARDLRAEMDSLQHTIESFNRRSQARA